jgi:hypothetical protein
VSKNDLFRKIVNGNGHASRAFTVHEMTAGEWVMLRTLIEDGSVQIIAVDDLIVLQPTASIPELLRCGWLSKEPAR